MWYPETLRVEFLVYKLTVDILFQIGQSFHFTEDTAERASLMRCLRNKLQREIRFNESFEAFLQDISVMKTPEEYRNHLMATNRKSVATNYLTESYRMYSQNREEKLEDVRRYLAALRQKLERIPPENGTPSLDDFEKCWKLVEEHHLNLVKQKFSISREDLFLLSDGTHPDPNQFRFSMNVRSLQGTNFVGNAGIQEDIVCGVSDVIQIYVRIYQMYINSRVSLAIPYTWLTKEGIKWHLQMRGIPIRRNERRNSLLQRLSNATREEVTNGLVIRFPNIENARETTLPLPFAYINGQRFICVPFAKAVTRRALNRTAHGLGIQNAASYPYGQLFNEIGTKLKIEN